MRYVRWLLLLSWFTPTIFLVSPFHEYANKANVYYVIFILAAISYVSIPIANSKIVIDRSIFINPIFIKIYIVIVSILCISTIIVIFMLLKTTGGLSQNREVFQDNFLVYNYLFVTATFFAVVLSITKYVNIYTRSFARFTWFLCAFLMLFTGNRQFAFFSFIFLIVYYLGLSVNPKIFYKVIILIAFIAIGAVAISVLRLDYLNTDDLSVVASYMSRLTGTTCLNEAFRDSILELFFQLFYAYLGMNYSGLTYALDFNSNNGGFPLISTSFPVIYRRFISLGLASDIESYNKDFDNYIATVSGGDYSHFFISLFGTIALEAGWVGLLISLFVIAYMIRVLSNTCNKKGANECDYIFYVFVITSLIFGLMQFPFSEPFVFFSFLHILFLYFFRNREFWPIIGYRQSIQ